MITSILKRMSRRRPQLLVLVVLLLGTFAVASVLAFHAYDAARSQRDQAEGTLRDWSVVALQVFNSRLQEFTVRGAFSLFAQVIPAIDQGPIDAESAASLLFWEGFCPCLREEGSTVYLGDLSTGAIEAAGAEPEAAVSRAWFLESVRVLPGVRVADHWHVGIQTATVAGASRFIVYAIEKDRDGRLGPVVVVEADGARFRDYLRLVWNAAPLLPAMKRLGISNDHLLALSVEDSGGGLRFASAGSRPTAYEASGPAGGSFPGRLTIGVSRGAEHYLLPGGLPSSRLPLLAALLLVTASLLVVASLLIRREMEITRLRADFIAGVSHELRTPLAQIRMFAETLLLGRVRSESDRRRSLEIIDQEARRLTHLVENVLLFARAERRSSRINPEPIDVAAEVRDAVHGFAILSRSRAVDIRPELQPGLTAPIDRGALRQVLLNLLDNAVKYGPLAQRIIVGAALFDRRLRIWVDDEGPGIPDDDRGRVFESFFRLERDQSSPIAGSGIGLAIVRELAELHGGRAWAEHAPGGGARMVVEFPGAYLRPEAVKDGWAVA